MPWQVFDHTADLGLRIEAETLPALFEEAARAFASLVVEDLDGVEARAEEVFELRAADPVDLLFDWLHALLVAFELRHLLFARARVSLAEPAAAEGVDGPIVLRASAWGERVDPARHRLVHEVKAITYHGLSLRRHDGGWAAEVIVDV